MERVFRLQKRYWYLGIGCLFFFAAMLAIPFYARSTGEIRWAGFWLMVGFWSFWIGLAVWMLLAYWRYSLVVHDGRLIQRGIVFHDEMGLSEAIELRWKPRPQGGLVLLHSASRKFKIDLSLFEGEERRWLIRWLRLALPESQQVGWGPFCRQSAWPLVQTLEDRPPQEGEVVLSRGRIDRIFVVLGLPVAAASVACAWWLQTPRHLAALVLLLFIWGQSHFGLPRRGVPIPRLSRTPGNGYFLFALILVGLAFVMIPLLRNHPWALWSVSAVYLAIVVVLCFRLDRRRKAALDAQVPMAVEAWDRVEKTNL